MNQKLAKSKLLILVRHPESEKNIAGTFSSVKGNELLTETGTEQLANFETMLARALIANCECGPTGIYCSTSRRTYESSQKLAIALDAQLCEDVGFNPIDAGQMAGMSEDESKQLSPEFMRQLELYRAGLLNSHLICGYGEDVKSFERRVEVALERSISSDHAVIVIVGHRSSITAILILLARWSLGYPAEFYGYVPLDLVGVSAVRLSVDGSVYWIGVNISMVEFIARLVSPV